MTGCSSTQAGPASAGASGQNGRAAAGAESDSGQPDSGAQTYCGVVGGILRLPGTDDLTGCSYVRGSLHLSDWAESSLPFESIQVVEENLQIFRPHQLTHLRGLDQLRRVGGELGIAHDDSGKLGAVDGLEALRECGSLHIRDNAGLTQLQGLRGLQVVHGDLMIVGNASLPQSEIDALLSHVKVEGAITLLDNEI